MSFLPASFPSAFSMPKQAGPSEGGCGQATCYWPQDKAWDKVRSLANHEGAAVKMSVALGYYSIDGRRPHVSPGCLAGAARHTEPQTHRHTDTRTHGHTDTRTHGHTDTRTHGHTDTQTRRHTDTQTHRHTDTQTHRHTHTHPTSIQRYFRNVNPFYLRVCHTEQKHGG